MGKSGKPGKPKQQHRVKVLHPCSRKASKVTGKCVRKQRIQRVHTETALKQTLLLDKLQWFKDNRDTNKDSYSRADMAELVQRYLRRFDDELEQIAIIHGMKSRKNRQHAAREDVITMARKREEATFKAQGIEMPDLSDAKNLIFFLNWDGTSRHAHLIKMRRVKISDALVSTKTDLNHPMDREDETDTDDNNSDEMKDKKLSERGEEVKVKEVDETINDIDEEMELAS